MERKQQRWLEGPFEAVKLFLLATTLTMLLYFSYSVQGLLVVFGFHWGCQTGEPPSKRVRAVGQWPQAFAISNCLLANLMPRVPTYCTNL